MQREAKPMSVLAEFRRDVVRQAELEQELRALRARQAGRIEKLKAVFPLGTHRRFRFPTGYNIALCLHVFHDKLHGLNISFEDLEDLESLTWPAPDHPGAFDELDPSKTLRLPHEPAGANAIDDEVA